jgi:hypothetical protein
MSCPMNAIWLRDRAVETRNLITLPSTFTQIFGADPMRFLVAAGWSLAQSLYWYFGSSTPTQAHVVWSQNSGNIMIDRSVWGDLITRPIWARTGTGGNQLLFTSLSYSPERYLLYEQYCERILSGSGPS